MATSSLSSARPWVQDEIDQYHLEKRHLERWLKEIFPKHIYGSDDFMVQLISDKYSFRVPRRLTQEEKDNGPNLRRWDADGDSRSDSGLNQVDELGFKTRDEFEPDSNPEIQLLLEWLALESVPCYCIASKGNAIPQGTFIPRDSVETYFRNDNYRRASGLLRACHLPHILPEDLALNCCRIFCILAGLGKAYLISTFVKYDTLWDNRLPFDPRTPPRYFPVHPSEHKFYEQFCAEQWRFCALGLQQSTALSIDDERPLAITALQQVAAGGSSTVYKANVHPQYDVIDPASPTHCYAIKTYRGRWAEINYNKETEAFQHLTEAGFRFVRGMVGFHGSFRYRGTLNLVLEYADGGTLAEYFQRVDPPRTGPEIIQFWAHLFETIKAIARIHKHPVARNRNEQETILYGWHQDLRPANILVVHHQNGSESHSSFKVCDLGSSYFMKAVQRELEPTGLYTFGTRTYGAPECYLPAEYTNSRNKLITQKVDIWSLGCIFSEAAVWVVKGWYGLDQYRLARKLTTDRLRDFRGGNSFHNGERRLEVVDQEHRITKPRCQKEDYVTVQVIENMIDEMLHHLPEHRPSAQQLEEKADTIISMARKSLGKSSIATPLPLPLSSERSATSGEANDESPAQVQSWSIPRQDLATQDVSIANVLASDEGLLSAIRGYNTSNDDGSSVDGLAECIRMFSWSLRLKASNSTQRQFCERLQNDRALIARRLQSLARSSLSNDESLGTISSHVPQPDALASVQYIQSASTNTSLAFLTDHSAFGQLTLNIERLANEVNLNSSDSDESREKSISVPSVLGESREQGPDIARQADDGTVTFSEYDGSGKESIPTESAIEGLQGKDHDEPQEPRTVVWTFKCPCGRIIKDVFTEYEPGAVEETMAQLLPNQKPGGNSRPSWSGQHFLTILQTFQTRAKDIFDTVIQQYARFRRERRRRGGGGHPTRQDDIELSDRDLDTYTYLFACFTQWKIWERTGMETLCIDMQTDRQLFAELRSRYIAQVGLWRFLFGIKRLKEIRFVKFNVTLHRLIDILSHSKDEKQREDAFPPRIGHPDYTYDPKPVKHLPPVGHQTLMELYHCPKLCDESRAKDFCIKRFPKHGRRDVHIDDDAEESEAWGIEFVQSRDWVYGTALGLLVLVASSIFAIVWSSLGKPVPSGLNVASYMIAIVAIMLTGAERLGNL